MTELSYTPAYESGGKSPLHYRFAGHIPLYGAQIYADRYSLGEPERTGLGALDLLSRGVDRETAAEHLAVTGEVLTSGLEAIQDQLGVNTLEQATATALKRGALQAWRDIRSPRITEQVNNLCDRWLVRRAQSSFAGAPLEPRFRNPPFAASNALHLVRRLYELNINTPAEDAFRAPAVLFSLPQPPPGLQNLPERARQIVPLRAAGLDNVAIANRLGISVNTVKTHLKRLPPAYHTNVMAEIVTKAIVTHDLPVERHPHTPRLSPMLLYSTLGAALGFGNREIARLAHVDENTIKSHIWDVRQIIRRILPNVNPTPRESVVFSLFRLGAFAAETYQQHYSMRPSPMTSPSD